MARAQNAQDRRIAIPQEICSNLGPVLTLEEALADREHQDSEFKTSTAETNKAAQTLVGFANSRGGQLFFGVTDAGRPIGIEYSDKVQRDLAAKLDAVIYPSLPLQFDPFPSESSGRRVLRVWTPADRPPIVGGYVYSKDRLTPESRVSLTRAQAYRRVGSRTQKIDFMWLRGTLPTDPLVLIDSDSAGSSVQNEELILNWAVWHASGGTAFELTVTTEPSMGQPFGTIKDLPGMATRTAGGQLMLNLAILRESIDLERVDDGQVGQFWLVARYRDEWSCEWESRRRVSVLLGPDKLFQTSPERDPLVIPTASTASTPEFNRRIVSLPPKLLASPADVEQ